MTTKTPPFSSLPLKKDGPRGNAWGLYGEGDELGMLHRLTPETTLAATKEIEHGIRISTDWYLDKPVVPCFKRKVFNHEIIHKEPRTVNDDILSLNTQSSSQWDGLRHFGYQDHQVYWNGMQQHEVHDSLRNGIHVMVENGGIVGRGVLLDYVSWAESQGDVMPALKSSVITVSTLEKIAQSQGVTFKPGDILFVRSGFVRALGVLPKEECAAFSEAPTTTTAIGVEASEDTLKWIWEHEFSAVAGDAVAFEPLPFSSKTHCLHEWLLAGWGMPIGELFDLEQLAEECKKLKKWSFFFSSMPLKVPGGVASPPNGVAIL